MNVRETKRKLIEVINDAQLPVEVLELLLDDIMVTLLYQETKEKLNGKPVENAVH